MGAKRTNLALNAGLAKQCLYCIGPEDRYKLRITMLQLCPECGEGFEADGQTECPVCRVKGPWLVQLKGKLSPGDPYELSVVRKDNEHGRMSWGRGGLGKLILFGTGLGQNGLSPITEENIDFALWIADTLCAALNKRGET